MADGGAGRPAESEQQPEQPGGTWVPDTPLQVEDHLLSGFVPETFPSDLFSDTIYLLFPHREELGHSLTESTDFLPNNSDDSFILTQAGSRPHHPITSSCPSSGRGDGCFYEPFPQSQPAYPKETRLHGVRASGDTIKRALLRSSRARRHVGVEDVFPLHNLPDDMKTHDESQDSTRNCEAADTNEAVLLGYDAQWCWVESQDDVMFL